MRGVGVLSRGVICDIRSWTGRVRSLPNLRYWLADQSWFVGDVDTVRMETGLEMYWLQ